MFCLQNSPKTKYPGLQVIITFAIIFQAVKVNEIYKNRACDWNLEAPVWQGKISVKARGERCFIQLEDQNTGQVFAVCNVNMDKQSETVEPVLDSSRLIIMN